MASTYRFADVFGVGAGDQHAGAAQRGFPVGVEVVIGDDVERDALLFEPVHEVQVGPEMACTSDEFASIVGPHIRDWPAPAGMMHTRAIVVFVVQRAPVLGMTRQPLVTWVGFVAQRGRTVRHHLWTETLIGVRQIGERGQQQGHRVPTAAGRDGKGDKVRRPACRRETECIHPAGRIVGNRPRPGGRPPAVEQVVGVEANCLMTASAVDKACGATGPVRIRHTEHRTVVQTQRTDTARNEIGQQFGLRPGKIDRVPRGGCSVHIDDRQRRLGVEPAVYRRPRCCGEQDRLGLPRT